MIALNSRRRGSVLPVVASKALGIIGFQTTGGMDFLTRDGSSGQGKQVQDCFFIHPVDFR